MTIPGAQHDCAVAFCCDQNYLKLALFMIRQIAFLNPVRRFDFVIASQDALELPDWAKSYGIRLHRTGILPKVSPPAKFRGSLAPYFRIMLPRELGQDYRRILYLDSDMIVDGGDFNRILNADIGPHPLAAARDAPSFYTSGFHAAEFQAAGMPAYIYVNTGALLIDTAAYAAQNVEVRAFEAGAEASEKYPHGLVCADQSLFNLALKGKFAELSPAWNWQLSVRLPMVTQNFPVFIRHFIGVKKPHRDATDIREVRFWQAYADYYRECAPEELATLPPPRDPGLVTFGRAMKLVMWHLQAKGLTTKILAPFKDPYFVKV